MTKKNHDVIVKAYLNKDEYERRSRGISHGVTKKSRLKTCSIHTRHIKI